MANQQKVAVLGAGVMGEALIAALIGSGVSPSAISIVEKRPDRCSELVGKYAITVDSLESAVSTSDVILLVVKPQDMQGLLGEIKAHINKNALVLSFVAGKKIVAHSRSFASCLTLRLQLVLAQPDIHLVAQSPKSIVHLLHPFWLQQVRLSK
jgi:pyrroline-5-carboxylate reductase